MESLLLHDDFVRPLAPHASIFFASALLLAGACSTPGEPAPSGSGVESHENATAAVVLGAPFERRVAAEWEPAVGVLITWPLMLPKDLVVDLARDTIVWVVVADDAKEREARAIFDEWGIAPERIPTIRRPKKEGAYGTRDWGAYAAFDERGALTMRDPRYIDYALSGYDSKKRLLWWTKLDPTLDWTSDDATPESVARALGFPREELTFCFTGGNVDVDGMGTAIATQILEDENAALGVPPERLRSEARRLLGIERLVLVPNFERSPGAQHIDCLAKLLDEERILVKRVPNDHPDHAQIEKTVEAVRALRGPWGRPYEILRIDAPRYTGDLVAAYTNSLILNRCVYVPLFGIAADEAALATYRAAMPGYEVRGYRAEGIMAWSYTDALHCRTKAIWDPAMLYLRHRRIDASVAPAAAHPVELLAWDHSGRGLDAASLKVWFRARGEDSWHSTPLEASETPGRFRASIPGAPSGTTIEYYLTAASRSGRRESHPRTAPAGFHSFRVE